jgi:hypothetical protein
MRRRSRPWPNPYKIGERVTYTFSVTLEGAPWSTQEKADEEAELLAQKMRGALAQEFPTRWSTASPSKDQLTKEL